ncbi:hypothetical protein PR202_ga26308 [Eleusine coracana subsp. coracana]|uniref:1-phosphatidylinositol-4-phosphate 5-kinase n=1 Tax=Eleusine coracana subsp. coracana TaxID=191504 RepID=A0AAV5DEL1_ELECO|nr:hypothetical protein PR202_ga26308 [Eleusine coracana subsp. coracana]
MPPRAAAASSQQGECCSHGLEPRWRAAAGEASCSYLPLRKRMSVDGKCPEPRICIWECDGEAGDITCDIVAAPLRRSCSARALPPTPAPLYRRIMTPPPPRPRPPPLREVEAARRPGEVICKGHRSYSLMLNLQLGISYSVGKSSALPFRKLSPSDFDPREKVWTRFPPEGSKLTPPHHSVDFRWKDYCPAVFRHLRKLFGVDPADYMLAICGNETLRELASPGKSGSCFFVTQDDRFMIKTVRKAEMKVRFIIMGNFCCSEYKIHRRFDLKGSSYGRTIDKAEEKIDETTTLKDLDLDYTFHLQRFWKPLIQLGMNMPAQAERRSKKILDKFLLNERHLFITTPTGGSRDVYLYFGIIDILQDYDITKKLEHAYKSFQVNPVSISAVDPKLYSRRFQDFIRRVFIREHPLAVARPFLVDFALSHAKA